MVVKHIYVLFLFSLLKHNLHNAFILSRNSDLDFDKCIWMSPIGW